MQEKASCLVAGGAGFIGSHLCKALLQRGHKVFCVDNLITGSENNISGLLQNQDFTFIKYDITQQLPVVGKIDYLFHFASPASVIDYQKFPKDTAMANSIGTMLLLDVVKAHKAKFLFASTSEIYGDPMVHPQTESYWGNVNPVGIRSCYDESKRFGETITMLYKREYGVDARIIRIFNTYGPRMRPTDGRVVSNFITQALAHKPLTIYGKGDQTRSFCYITDLVEGIISAMFTPQTQGEIFNLGNPDERKIIDFAQTIITLCKSPSRLTFCPLPNDDPLQRKPDISKAERKLHWKPNVSLEDGIKKTIAYYKSL